MVPIFLPELKEFLHSAFDRFENTLLLARDKFGVKPLYYYTDDTQFMFASEYKSFANPSFIADVNFDTLFRTILLMYNPGNETAFRHVNKVPAGCYILHKANCDIRNLLLLGVARISVAKAVLR